MEHDGMENAKVCGQSVEESAAEFGNFTVSLIEDSEQRLPSVKVAPGAIVSKVGETMPEAWRRVQYDSRLQRIRSPEHRRSNRLYC